MSKLCICSFCSARRYLKPGENTTPRQIFVRNNPHTRIRMGNPSPFQEDLLPAVPACVRARILVGIGGYVLKDDTRSRTTDAEFQSFFSGRVSLPAPGGLCLWLSHHALVRAAET